VIFNPQVLILIEEQWMLWSSILVPCPSVVQISTLLGVLAVQWVLKTVHRQGAKFAKDS